MDERIRELKEGAGREESRINEEFIEFLNKWSTPVLVVLAALAVAYWGWNKYKALQIAKVNEATSAYTSAVRGNPNPDTLANIAEEFSSVRSFGHLARLDLADTYLLSVERGLMPGVEFDPANPPSEADVLDEQMRQTFLERAASLYRQVYEATNSVRGKEPLAIEAAFGLAAVAESRGDIEGAKRHIEDAKRLAEKMQYTALAMIAENRLQTLNNVGPVPALYDAANLPPLPEPEPIEPPATDESGSGIEVPADAPDDASSAGEQTSDDGGVDPAAENQPGDEGSAEQSRESDGGG
ncbi:MAG: hypothetical protein D6695_05385 [Planctomycetota bacterium]|nr:MAG: hypothetical protein D6695_05385 [Planctomycetota bacterium]